MLHPHSISPPTHSGHASGSTGLSHPTPTHVVAAYRYDPSSLPSTVVGTPTTPKPQLPPQSQPQPQRKRKKTEDDKGQMPSEPRRLRRLHEACARCRGKKIKCDSKHPNCGACESAGVECKQEDRHRQTLQPRGHLEHLESQLAKCNALLSRLVHGFNIDQIDRHMEDNGVSWPPPSSYEQTSPYSAPSTVFPPSPFVAPKPPTAAVSPPSEVSPFTTPPARGVDDIKGSDPNNLDLSSTRGLSKSFGVARVITKNLPTETSLDIREDLAVEGYISGQLPEGHAPPVLNPSHWQHSRIMRSTKPGAQPEPPVEVWLPYDQARAFKIVDVYFRNLEMSRPIFIRREFIASLRALYRLVGGGPPISYQEAIEGEDPPQDERSHNFASYLSTVHDDPGFLCSVYLVFALGTLSETNHLMHDNPEAPPPTDWPSHVLFFNLALRIKPDLRVTISSLQALILLHWYLYTERNGRTLWRLVGNTIRLCVELGLHHDPTQQACFTREEAHVRKCLWSMALIHDRGTSLILGRPLAIADVDYNTPLPDQYFNGRKMFSDYIRDCSPIVVIQGDIITSLYRPGKLDGYTLMRHATRINHRFVKYRNELPQPEYQWVKLVDRMTDDHGMTVLKYYISRLMLLRTMFNATQLNMNIRQQALKDAVVTSHNVLALHQHLTRSPDVAFFVSPIPIHVAAMVILYAEISNCIHIPRAIAKHDIQVALTIVPNRRWRWQRKDLHASHPLISALAERHYGVDFTRELGPAPPPMLMSEIPWPFGDVDSLQIAPDEPVPSIPPVPSVSRRREMEYEMRREVERRKRYPYDPTAAEPASATTAYGPEPPSDQMAYEPAETKPYELQQQEHRERRTPQEHHTPPTMHAPVQPNHIPDRLFYPMSLEENLLNFRGLSHPHHLHGSEFIPQMPQPDAIPEVLAR
ncbi:fungal-specific transcription factor domain-containing protein [Rhizoctonia solani]|nr:fungal-specific transcription factor domain-containing protein [Rhizoctonia solani]